MITLYFILQISLAAPNPSYAGLEAEYYTMNLMQKQGNSLYKESVAVSATAVSDDNNQVTPTDLGRISIGYPLGKTVDYYYVFINRKRVARLTPGGRVTVHLKENAAYMICISDLADYKEGFTQSANSRTITVKGGTEYYFFINRRNQLDYMFNAEKGEKAFNNPSSYKSTPITTPPIDSTILIPSL